MNAIKKLESEHENHKKIIEKNDGKTYFDKVMANEKSDPGSNRRQYNVAIEAGKSSAARFMSKVHDHTHPGHLDALTDYRDKYDANPENVVKDFTSKAVKAMGVTKNFLPNANYEQGVLNSHRTQTATDVAFLNKHKDYMKTKWDAVGYDGDMEFNKAFWAEHPMSAPPIKTIAEDGKLN